MATRKSGQAALDVIGAAVPELFTSSADLTPSNNTKFRTKGNHGRRLLRPLHPLGHPRARDDCGMQRLRRAWRLHPLRGVVFLLHRLLPALAEDRGADEGEGRACVHPRLDRPWRGWPDPSAGRASGGDAGDAEFLCLAACRQRRARRMLAGGAQARAFAFDPRADPAGSAGTSDHACGGKLVRPRRLRDFSCFWTSGRVHIRLRLRSVARRRRAGAVEGEGRGRPGRVDALLPRVLRAAGRSIAGR